VLILTTELGCCIRISQTSNKVTNCLTLLHLASFEYFAPKKNRSHVVLCERNSGAKSGRELSKGSKDSASLLVYTWK